MNNFSHVQTCYDHVHDFHLISPMQVTGIRLGFFADGATAIVLAHAVSFRLEELHGSSCSCM